MGAVFELIMGIIAIAIFAMPIWLFILIAALAENHVNPKKKKHDIEVFVYRYPNDIIIRTEYSPEQINRSDIQLLQAPSWYKPPIDAISYNTDETVENIITITPPVKPTIEPTMEPTIEISEELIEVHSVVDTNDTVSTSHVSSIYPLGIYDESIERCSSLFELNKQYDRRLSEIRKRYNRELSEIKKRADKRVSELDKRVKMKPYGTLEQYKKELDDLSKLHEKELDDLSKQNEKALDDLRKQYDKVLDTLSRQHERELKESEEKVYKESHESKEQDDRATYEMIKQLMCEEYSSDTFVSYEEFLVYNSMEDGPQKLRKRMHDDFLKRMKERATQRKPINRDVMSNHVKYISDSSRLDICKWTQVIMTNLCATPRDIADELGVNLMSVARFTSGEGYYVNIKLLAWFLNNDGYSDTHIIQERFAYENYDKKIRPIPSRSEYSLVLNTVYNSYIKAKNSGDQNVKLVLYMEYTKLQENDTVKQIEMSIIKPMLYYRYKDSEKTS